VNGVKICTPITYGEYSGSAFHADAPGFLVEQYNGKVGWVNAGYHARPHCEACKIS